MVSRIAVNELISGQDCFKVQCLKEELRTEWWVWLCCTDRIHTVEIDTFTTAITVQAYSFSSLYLRPGSICSWLWLLFQPTHYLTKSLYFGVYGSKGIKCAVRVHDEVSGCHDQQTNWVNVTYPYHTILDDALLLVWKWTTTKLSGGLRVVVQSGQEFK